MTRKTNAWGRPITEATPTTVQNPWLTRMGKSPAPAAKPAANPWIARMKLQTPQPEEPTTTARFGIETTPVGPARNPWGREKVEQKTTPVTETKPAPKLAPIPIPKATKAKQEAKPAGGGRVTIITDNPERVRAQIREMREVLARLK